MRMEWPEGAVARARRGALCWLRGNRDGYPRSRHQESIDADQRGYEAYDDCEAPPIIGYEELEREGLATRVGVVIGSHGQERVHFRIIHWWKKYMRKLFSVLTTTFLLLPLAASAVTDSFTISVTTTFSMPGSDVIHFMAADGCDHNTGTAISGGDNGTCAGSAGQTGPWATPNHALNCGDVIVAAAGNYTNAKNTLNTWGTVSTCPSTTGGIDGNGGIYAAVLLCGGSDLTACVVNCDSGSPCAGPGFGPPVGFDVEKNNWAVEGWVVNGNSNASNLAFQASGCGSSVTHHVYFINNIAYNTGQGWQPADCATAFGVDYVRIVGMITENAVLFTGGGGICIGAIDVVVPGKFGTSTTDVHYFIYNNYSYNNIDTGCDSAAGQADGEDFLFDTLDSHSVIGKYVLANNIGFYAERECINNFWGGSLSTLTMRQYNNTCFDNAQRGSEVGEVFGTAISQSAPTSLVQIFNNISYQNNATNQAGNPTIAIVSSASTSNSQIGAEYAVGAENIFYAASTTCPAATCNAGPPYIEGSFNSASYGTNTLVNPSFKNTTDLINNHLGVPNCAGFTLTTTCLGWNSFTQTGTSLSIIDDLVAQCAQCTGKGFQAPIAGCLSSGELFNDYPPDLKGLVALHWNGTIVQQVAGLANVPCGM
jgi:hypothetical protein